MERIPDLPCGTSVPGDETVVRPMRSADLPQVLEIERRTFSSPWEERTFHGLLRRPTAVLMVADQGGRVAGYAVVWFAGGEAELGDLAVRPELQRTGIGRTLVRHAIREARARGARRLYLEVRKSNVPARVLYESTGFHVSGLRKAYYTSPVEDALLMTLDL